MSRGIGLDRKMLRSQKVLSVNLSENFDTRLECPSPERHQECLNSLPKPRTMKELRSAELLLAPHPSSAMGPHLLTADVLPAQTPGGESPVAVTWCLCSGNSELALSATSETGRHEMCCVSKIHLAEESAVTGQGLDQRKEKLMGRMSFLLNNWTSLC